MVNIGDSLKCPQCSRVARVVWISRNGEQVGVRCSGQHNQISRGVSRFGSAVRPMAKAQKNMVFLVDSEMAAALASIQR